MQALNLVLLYISIYVAGAIDLKIIGGNIALWNDYEPLVHLTENNVITCGGSMLNKDTILTAAHCVEGIEGKLQVVSLKASGLSRRHDGVESKKKKTHKSSKLSKSDHTKTHSSTKKNSTSKGHKTTKHSKPKTKSHSSTSVVSTSTSSQQPTSTSNSASNSILSSSQIGGIVTPTQSLSLTSSVISVPTPIQNPINNNSGNYLVHNVKSIRKHEKYVKSQPQYDIAIIKLETPVQFNKFFKLDTRDLAKKEGSEATLVGWGRTDRLDRYSISNTLKKATVPIYNFDKCKKAYLNTKKPINIDVDNSCFCAGFEDGRLNACEGDSGGPLLIGDTIIGITAFVGSVQCAVKDLPGGYTHVFTFLDWIQKNIN